MFREIRTRIYHLMHPKMAVFLTSGGGKLGTRNWKPNVMACAWATPVSEEPPMLLVCVWNKDYTAKLIRETREFAISIPTRKMATRLLYAGKVSGKHVDKFRKFGIETANAKKVSVPIVKGCVGYLECKLWKTVEAGECYVFFGRIVSAYADGKYFRKGKWSEDAKIPFHLGGKEIVYFKRK